MYNVLIRPLKEEDALISYRWRNDPDVWRYTGHKPDQYITEGIEQEWIRKALKDYNSYRFAILVNNEYIGNIQITNINPKEDGEYHIFIGEKKFWRRGIATLASQQLIRFAFERLSLKKLYLYVNVHNQAAIGLYQKFGFVTVSDEVKMEYSLTNYPNPLVSVFMMAYNHEPYIKTAIETVLCQKTDFDFDLVIGEDCSSDNTREIIKNIANQYPGKFRILIHDKNIGPQANQLAVFEACTGKYIAMCEGDDYWDDTCKLMKQVSFLENHPDYSLSTHNAKVLWESNKRKEKLFNGTNVKETSDIKDLIQSRWFIPTASMVFKRSFLELPEWLKYIQQGDLAIALLLALKGRIHYLDEPMSIYRKNPTSVGAKTSDAISESRKLDLLSYFDYYTNFIYHENILKRKKSINENMYYHYLKDSGKIIRYLNINYVIYKLKFLYNNISNKVFIH